MLLRRHVLVNQQDSRNIGRITPAEIFNTIRRTSMRYFHIIVSHTCSYSILDCPVVLHLVVPIVLKLARTLSQRQLAVMLNPLTIKWNLYQNELFLETHFYPFHPFTALIIFHCKQYSLALLQQIFRKQYGFECYFILKIKVFPGNKCGYSTQSKH